jgi:putative DNA methylase
MTYYERRLPHWQPQGRDLFLTWRLSGSLLAKTMAALSRSKTPQLGNRFVELDRELDKSASGPLWCKEERVAALVASGIESAERKGLCRVHAWVIMPNHVHILLQPGASLAAITQGIKGSTARQANSLLGRTGTLARIVQGLPGLVNRRSGVIASSN